MAGPSGLFEVAFDEEDVRRQSGAGAFARADGWQRAGHVRDATVDRRRLGGAVQGTLRRVDEVQVEPEGQRLKGDCSCGRPGVCVHAAALLLHWLRQPTAFTPTFAVPGATGIGDLFGLEELDEDELDDSDLAAEEAETTPEDVLVSNLRELLQRYTHAQLRDIARKRGVRGSSKSRAELIELLPPLLAAPESVDVALGGLDADERLLLQATYLLGSELATNTHLEHAYRVLGGPRGDLPIVALTDRALAMPPSEAVPGPMAYAVPQSVAARLPHLADLAQPHAPPSRLPGLGAVNQGLDALQLIVLLVAEVARGQLQPDYAPVSQTPQGMLPPGWVPAEPGAVERLDPGGPRRTRAALRLIPAPSLLGDTDRARLGRAAGRPPACLATMFELCRALGIIAAPSGFAAEDSLFQALLLLPKLQRLALLAGSLLGMNYPEELVALLGPHGPLQFFVYPGYFAQQPLLLYQTQRVRALVYRALRLLPPGTWHDVGALLQSLQAWVPWQATELSFAHRAPGHPMWWIADPKTPTEPLPLDTTDGWRRVYGAVIRHLLTGPLSWLGVVETHADSRGLQAFRVLPEAGRALASDYGPVPEGKAGRLSVQADGGLPLVRVPPGGGDGAAYALLAQADPLMEATPAGLQFRLTPLGLETLFGEGRSGPELLQFLRERATESPPASVRATINRWWQSYGRVRLYDDVTLLELADDYLLSELLASTSLADAVVHTFSPRLVALDPTKADAVIAELTRRGRPPKVVEAGA